MTIFINSIVCKISTIKHYETKMIKKELEIIINKLNTEVLSKNDVVLDIARLDLLHKVVSGNKIFKLAIFLKEATSCASETIITFGGPYSNHLVATAFQCNILQLNCVGIVRGTEPQNYSHTLKDCIDYGMKLKFISKEDYKIKEETEFYKKIKSEYNNAMVIPEGGYNNTGAEGASYILDYIDLNEYTHICTPIGTATTLAGLVMKAEKNINILGFPVLKNMHDIKQRLNFLLQKENFKMPVIMNEYHFGGYAKKNTELIDFMNTFYNEFQIPTDFVYTGKMMYGVFDLLKNGYFKKGSKILCLHTGGLQGNLSLPAGTLVF